MQISILDLVFPAACIVCERKPKPQCPNCIPNAMILPVRGFDFPVFAALPHQGAIEKMIAGYKDQQLLSLGASLAKLVAQLFMEVDIASYSAVITPARNAKNFRKRGFDPAFCLAKQAVRLLPIGVDVHPLKPTRGLEDQRHLGKAAREINVAKSMRLEAKLAGPVLLFDDVLTTGSTIQEMARACRASSVEVGVGCVLAQRNSIY